MHAQLVSIGNSKEVRPCVVLSPDKMNRHLQTVTIAPIKTKSYEYPSRVTTKITNKKSWIILDQIRTVDRRRLIKNLGKLDNRTIAKVKNIIKEMLVD